MPIGGGREIDMYKQERLNSIIDILKKNGYVTVKFLVEELHYSNATINRDLILLEKQQLIKRSYGGVEIAKDISNTLPFRYHKMKTAKNNIGKTASKFIKDGDTIFMDGSTTSQYIGKYITEKKDITVITNNIALVTYLSEYNINVICLGGKVVEIPSRLSGPETVENAMKYRADKMFFSIGAVGEDGRMGTSDTYYLLLKAMMHNSKEVFLLADSGKINRKAPRFFSPDTKIDYIISNYDFPKETKEKLKSVKFIKVK